MKTVSPRPTEDQGETPLFRSRRNRPTGHVMIGLALHAADQPGATPETRALAQRLRTRHPATNIGE